MYEDTIEVGQDKNIWEIRVWSDILRLTFVIVDDMVWMLVSPNMNKCASFSTCVLTLDIVFLIRIILSVWSHLTVILIYISIVTNEGEQLFICMLTFNISSLVKSLFKLCPFFFFLTKNFFFKLFIFWSCQEACRILVSWTGIKPAFCTLEVQSCNHWKTKEVLALPIFKLVVCLIIELQEFFIYAEYKLL